MSSPSSIEGFALSPLQQRAWSLTRAHDEWFGVRGRIALRGALDLGRLEAAMADVVRAHEILRTTFPLPHGMDLPVQAIAAEPRVLWHVGAEPPLDGDPDAVGGAVTQDSPPVSVHVDTRTASVAFADITLPATIADTRTLLLLVQELALAYDARGATSDGRTIGGPTQYADVSGVLLDCLAEPAAHPGKRFWEGKTIARATLPYERPDGACESGRAWMSAAVRRDLLGQIDACCAAWEVTRHACFVAACLAVMRRLTRDRDCRLNVVVDGRTAAPLAEVMGPLSRCLPLVVAVPPAMRAGALPQRCQQALAEAVEWQHYFDPAAAGREQLGWTVAYERIVTPSAGDLMFDVVSLRSRTEHDRGQLTMWDRGSECTIEARYDQAAIAPAAVARLLDHIIAGLREIVEMPTTPVRALTCTGHKERARVDAFGRGCVAGVDVDDDTVLTALAREVSRRPDAIAAIHGEAHVTFGVLSGRAARVAADVRAQGLCDDRPVAICVDRGMDMLVAVLGVLHGGGAVVPLDTTYPLERIRYMLADSRPALVVADAAHAPLFADAGIPVWRTDEHRAMAGGDSPHGQGGVRRVRPDQLAYVIYTSGSTGRPKGSAVSHRALWNHMRWQVDAFALTEQDVVLQKTPVSFDASVWELYAPLVTGGRLVLAPPDVHHDPATLIEMTCAEQVTVLQVVPSLLGLLLELPGLSTCAALRVLCCGGEALPPAHVKAVVDRLKIPLVNLYGPTEATIDATSWRGDAAPGSTIPIGRPIDNMEAYVVDDLTLLPAGVAGELWLGGVGLARGYLNQPALTAERFVPHPWAPHAGARLYRTGDRAVLRDTGDFEFLGRLDHQVKLRGHRIELREIESALLEAPAVRNAAALLRRGAAGQDELIAYVTPSASAAPGAAAARATLDAGALRGSLAKVLPAFMIPSRIHVLRDLPTLANGKIDRAALAAREESADGAAAFQPPETAVERQLATLWQELLLVRRVGRHDNFFELGGDSITSIQVAARAARSGLRLTSAAIFEHQTLSAIAAHAEAESASGQSHERVVGPVPLSPIQRRFFERPFQRRSHFNQAVILRGADTLVPHPFHRAVWTLLDHHDALRARFEQIDGAWHQHLLTEERAAVAVWIDLGALPAPRQRQAMSRIARDVQRSLDITNGPLCRFAAIDLGAADRPRVLIVVHHLVMDGVSWRILLDDFASAYRQHLAQDRATLPPKRASIQQWAIALEALARSEAIAAERDFWIATAPRDAAGLGVRAADGTNTIGGTASVSGALDVEETRHLLRFALRQLDAEIDDVLLATVGEALCRWTGGTSVCVDVEGHGRDSLGVAIDVTRTVGWFTIVYPLRIDSQPDVSWRRRIQALRARRRAIPRTGAGYGLLRYLTPHQADLGLADVAFNYLGQLDHVIERRTGFSSAPDGAGPTIDDREAREYLLEATGMVQGGRLVFQWRYSTSLYDADAVQRLVRLQVQALREVLVERGGAESPATARPEAAALTGDLSAIAAELGLEQL